jgi:uncharacterized membrane protein YtjA (UPF0391 family)
MWWGSSKLTAPLLGISGVSGAPAGFAGEVGLMALLLGKCTKWGSSGLTAPLLGVCGASGAPAGDAPLLGSVGLQQADGSFAWDSLMTPLPADPLPGYTCGKAGVQQGGDYWGCGFSRLTLFLCR